MGEKGIPNVVVMGTGEANLDPLRKARDEALAREAKAKKLPFGVGAAGSGELSTPEELEKAEKESEKMVAKAEAKLAELFDWLEIEKLVVSTYSSQKIQHKIKDNLVKIKKSLLETVQAAPQSFSSLDETGLENVIKQHVKKENDKLNDKHKILHAEIEKSCQKEPEPAEKATDPDKKTPKLTTPEESKDKKELGKIKKKIDGRKKAVIEHLGKLFKKESLIFEHERDAIRFKEKVLFPGKFRVDIGKINIASLSEAEKTEILAYVDLANGEIKQKISERVAEVDAFLASLAKKVEPVKPTDPIKPVVSTEPAEPVLPKAPAGEKYLGEEISEEKIKEEIIDAENFGTENPNPESRILEEDPEERERTTREKQERLAQLKTEVDQARKEYVEMDYEKKKAWNRLKSFMPSLFKDQREEDQDVAYYRAQYDNKLFEYKNLLLGDAKEKNVSNKELGDLVKIFAGEANLSMADTHTEVKIEHLAGSVSGKLKDFSLKMIDSYKKLPTKTKLAIGAAFLGAGAVTGAIGIGAGAVVTATALKRFFMGAVTGTTVALGLEFRGRGKTEQGIEKMVSSLSEGLEGRSAEEKLRITQEIINKLIYDEDQKINKIKNKNIRNLAVGIGVGTLVGSASHWLGMLKNTETGREILGSISGGINRIAEYFHNPLATVEGSGTGDITNNNPEYSGYWNHIKIILGGAKSHTGVGLKTGIPSAEHAAAAGVGSHVGQEGLHNAGTAGVGAHAEAPVGPNAVYDKPLDDSQAGKIFGGQEDGAADPDKSSDIVGEIKQEIPHAEVPVEPAAENPAIVESPSETPAVADPEVTEAGPSNEAFHRTLIEGDSVEKPIIGYLDEHPEAEGVDAPDAEASSEDIGNSGTEDGGHFIPENTPETEIHHGIEVPENGTGEFVIDPETSTGIDEMGKVLGKVDANIEELDGRILRVASGQYESEDIWPNPETKLDELREQKQMLEQARQNLLTRIQIGYSGSLRKLIYGSVSENFEKMGKMPVRDLLHNKSSLGYKFFARVMNSESHQMLELRRHISPLDGEKVDDWILRIGKIMKKFGIRKI